MCEKDCKKNYLCVSVFFSELALKISKPKTALSYVRFSCLDSGNMRKGRKNHLLVDTKSFETKKSLSCVRFCCLESDYGKENKKILFVGEGFICGLALEISKVRQNDLLCKILLFRWWKSGWNLAKKLFVGSIVFLWVGVKNFQSKRSVSLYKILFFGKWKCAEKKTNQSYLWMKVLMG